VARPQTVHGLKPDATVRANAQKIVATRTAEFFSFAPYLANAAYVTQLHDMRIAAKRLRYALEIFAPALDPDAAHCTAIVKAFQEIVGEIHDADVLVDVVRDQLIHRTAQTATALADLAAAGDVDSDAVKEGARSFVTATDWVNEQVALAAMIARTVRDRQARFTELQEKWEEWRASGLRERLEALTVDLPADVTPAVRPPARAKHAVTPAPTDDVPTVAPGLVAPAATDAAHGSGKNGHRRRGLIRSALRRTPKH
jgi:CHAD domain-containing protein